MLRGYELIQTREIVTERQTVANEGPIIGINIERPAALDADEILLLDEAHPPLSGVTVLENERRIWHRYMGFRGHASHDTSDTPRRGTQKGRALARLVREPIRCRD